MKVFVIPSWYPSLSNPIYGTFVKEQISIMSRIDSTLHFGISLWGQGDKPYLLYSRQPFTSLLKLARRLPDSRTDDSGTISTYTTPAYTWNKRWKNGNLEGIKKANEVNMKRYIEDHGLPDLIHVQASYPGAWVAQNLSYKYAIPYIVTLRMGPFPFTQFRKNDTDITPDLRFVLSKASMLIATSQSLGNRMLELNFSKLKVISNPVDTTLFVPSDQQVINKKIKVLSVGRLETEKGFDILIKSISMIKFNPEFSVEIIGAGSELKQLKKLTKKLNLENKISFSGISSRIEVAEKMKDCDLYVLPSRYETFGNVIVEAMACGKPVVATKCGGPENIVTNKTGVLCEPSDPNSLAKAIEEALNVRWNQKTIREYAEDNYSPELFTRRMKDVYEEVVREHRSTNS